MNRRPAETLAASGGRHLVQLALEGHGLFPVELAKILACGSVFEARQGLGDSIN